MSTGRFSYRWQRVSRQIWTLLVGGVIGSTTAASVDSAETASGASLYTELCQSCHGFEGDGNGPAAAVFPLRPRPFSQAAFKFDTDADWETGTDADLANVIRQGAGVFGGSMQMPPWPGLTDAEIAALIGYIRSLDRTPPPAAGLAPAPDFAQIFTLLQKHCGECHVRGAADGPWSLDAPADETRFSDCLRLPEADRNRCTTHHQLVDPPGPDIPAWIRPEDAAGSEPYVEACAEDRSFHIGHSLPQALSPEECARILRWIEAGAGYQPAG